MQSFTPNMTPAPGDLLQRFIGDYVRFTVNAPGGGNPEAGWRALLRTNLGRADQLRREILESHTQGLPQAGASWRDVPMHPDGHGWFIDMPLAEVGYFKAKAYVVDPRGWQHWPDGRDIGVAVHPDQYRTGNTIYCAFTRLFGESRSALSTTDEKLAKSIAPLDQADFTVIPPSGKLRDLTAQLPHIIDTLGCKIVHLLPIHPTPTTYARFGRFGSPYAALDLTAIDPALVVFDKRTTGIDQFCELTCAVHARGARVILDIVINHTGWGSVLQDNHPEWFLREKDGRFVSPGAWGTTWEDLVELKHQNVGLWDELAEMFLTWCRRGVDGFRCDAGYKVPVAAWQYIIARVQQEFPEALFLLEGLGGAWEATEALLTEGGMQWAYSELFQNYSAPQVAGYLDHALKQNGRVGLLAHYSETHDNDRLAKEGRGWSLLRNRLCALTSVHGGFGFTCGVEWLATEKILVHGCTGLNWGGAENVVKELAQLNQLLKEHPCFYDGAKLKRLSGADSSVYALWRESDRDSVLVLVNTDIKQAQALTLEPKALNPATNSDLSRWVDLLGQPAPKLTVEGGRIQARLEPGAVYCLSATPVPVGLHGDAYRRARAQAGWGLTALNALFAAEEIGHIEWRELAEAVNRSPREFLATISQFAETSSAGDLMAFLRQAERQRGFARVVDWSLLDALRVTPVPPGHWLLLHDKFPFRATLRVNGDSAPQHLESIPVKDSHIACFAPRQKAAEATLKLERYNQTELQVQGQILFLAATPEFKRLPNGDDLVLLTNGRGGMARLRVDLGRVLSKYDCVLGANLHPTVPVDRHVLAKRIRVWVNADGFISPLDFRCLKSFEAGPPAVWNFVANAGDGRTVEIQMIAGMVPGRNTTEFKFVRPAASEATGKQLPAEAEVRLTVRLDIEDRNFHWETRRNGGAEHHFASNTRPMPATELPAAWARPGQARSQASNPAEEFVGFVFTPAQDRQLRVFSAAGCYHPQPEWSENLPHPIEQSRGQTGSGDAFSPGWFELPLPKGASVKIVVTADPVEAMRQQVSAAGETSGAAPADQSVPRNDFAERLNTAVRAFVVHRDEGKTVIAGYPWFLDWGRDTFICARGLLAAGMSDEVRQIVLAFGGFEKDGTLPNTIFGHDASNRDTSDAPLWFGLVCEELQQLTSNSPVLVSGGRPLPEILSSIARGYAKGTPNGIRMDPRSALIWSPSHFTWMDTNYPAGTPRQGYPVEIQVLWIRLLNYLARIGKETERSRWQELARQATASLEQHFWRETEGYYADVLLTGSGQGAAEAVVDDALRSNCLFAVSLGVARGERAQRCVEAARRYLVVPGALRSLAPLQVSVPLPIQGNGGLLNDPRNPYWGHYEGDEDTRRKPAYHNGTAWTWTFPVFCEALARAWDFAPSAVAAARAYLGSMAGLMEKGCLGHIPEILDGDAPHLQRGCDAQAWGATEALRVWRLLESRETGAG